MKRNKVFSASAFTICLGTLFLSTPNCEAAETNQPTKEIFYSANGITFFATKSADGTSEISAQIQIPEEEIGPKRKLTFSERSQLGLSVIMTANSFKDSLFKADADRRDPAFTLHHPVTLLPFAAQVIRQSGPLVAELRHELGVLDTFKDMSEADKKIYLDLMIKTVQTHIVDLKDHLKYTFGFAGMDLSAYEALKLEREISLLKGIFGEENMAKLDESATEVLKEFHLKLVALIRIANAMAEEEDRTKKDAPQIRPQQPQPEAPADAVAVPF